MRQRARLFAMVLAIFPGYACKKAASPRAPSSPPDDIATIEAVLDENAAELRTEGIAVVGRRPPTSPTASEPALPPAEEESPERDEDMNAEPAAPSAVDRGDAVQTRQMRSGWFERWRLRKQQRRETHQRCERVCDLADATCELSDRICALAGQHPGEVRYEDACERSGDQCRAASEVCTNC
jgi:hypothetical protein